MAMQRFHMRWIPQPLAHIVPAVLIAGGICIGVASSTAAPNADAQPIYGTLQLKSPFKPDPVKVSVSAGGEVNARELGFHPGCTGFFNPEAPHIRLNYTSSGIAMQVYVGSAADTTLIIRTPDGSWRCDDDSLAKNPAVRFAQPKDGTYDIWVGAFGGGRPQADVHITER